MTLTLARRGIFNSHTATAARAYVPLYPLSLCLTSVSRITTMQHPRDSSPSRHQYDREFQRIEDTRSFSYYPDPNYLPQQFQYRPGDDAPFIDPEAYQQWQDTPERPYIPPPYSRTDHAYTDARTPGSGGDTWRQPVTHPTPPFPPTGQVRTFHSQSPSHRSPSPSRPGAYDPPHLRGYPSHAPQSHPVSSRATSSSKKGNYTPVLPPREYIELSRPSPPKAGTSTSTTVPKLLVLDLNGALIYRSGSRGTERTIYPRPYLGNFLEYLFGPLSNSNAALARGERPWNVFVWSSAQPHNVRAMVETGFGARWIEGVYSEVSERQKEERLDKGEGRLMGVWARDRMDLSSSDYSMLSAPSQLLQSCGM